MMALSIISLATAALALAGNAAAKKWYLEDKYDSSNFFDKFVFNTAPDPNSGFVTYRSQADAVELGIASVSGGEVKLGVDNKSILSQNSPGRSSVRLESRARFNKNLIVARFSHFPESKCSSWPAFWTVGDNWPLEGEVDMLESWNMDYYNKPAYHMGNPGFFGQCTLDGADQFAVVATKNCDNGFQDVPRQWPNQGCVSNDLPGGPHASPDGGVYAMEWTEDFIKVYSWRNEAAPRNIDSDAPDTSDWGIPTAHLKSSSCNIDKVFKNQRLIVNIALCGNPVGDSPGLWDECRAITKSTCADYVRYNPSAFDNVYFKIKDIRIFGQNPPKTATTSTASTVSTKTFTTSSSTATNEVTSTTNTTTVSSTASSTTSSSATSSVGTTTMSAASTAASSTASTASETSSSSALSSSTKAVVADGTSTAPSSSTHHSAIKASISSATGTSSKTVYTAITSCTTYWAVADMTSVLNMSTKDVSTKTRAATEFTTASTIANASAPGIISSTTTHKSFNSTTNNANANVTTSSVEMNTSTVYNTTAIQTITGCKRDVTNCPIGNITTLTIPLNTTYSPGGGFTTQSPFHPAQTSKKTIVLYETHTIVPNKPILSAGGQNGTANATSIVEPRPSAHGSVSTEKTVPRPTGDNICPGPDCPTPAGISGACPLGISAEKTVPRPTGDNICAGPDCPPPTDNSGASTRGISLAMLIGGLVALLL